MNIPRPGRSEWAPASAERRKGSQHCGGRGVCVRPEPRRPGSLRLVGLVPEPSGEVAQAGEGGRSDPSSRAALPRAAVGHPPSEPLPGREPLPPAPPCARLGLDGRRRSRRRRLPEPTSAAWLGQSAAQRGAAGPEHFPRSRCVPTPGLHQPCVRQVTRGLRECVCLSVSLSHTHTEAGVREEPETGDR